MKLKGSKINELGHLSALCKEDLATTTKIALLSFQQSKSYPILEIFILLIEYLQLASQSFLARNNSNDGTEDDNLLSSGVIFVAKLLHPGYWLTFDSDNNLAIVILTVALIYILFKYLIFGYIVFVAYNNIPHNPVIAKIWKWNFKLQGRVICFILTSFWLLTILATLKDNVDIFGIGKAGTTGLFVALMLIEYIFSLFLNTQYCMIVPIKSLLSSKGYHIENLTLAQKFATQTLRVIFAAYSVNSNIVFALMSIVFSVVRNTHYFVTFPLYNLNVLIYQAFLLMAVSSLEVSCLFQIITESLGYEDDVLFITIVWVILTILTTKIAYEYLLKTRLNLITKNGKVSPRLLIHKIIAIKELRKQKKTPGEFNLKYEYAYLLTRAIDAGIESVFDLDIGSLKTDDPTIDFKDSANELFANYLDGLLTKFPRNNFIKLYIAEFYAKKLKLYGVAMKLLTGLQNSQNNVVSLNASILIWNIQNLIRTKGTTDENQINLYVFFKTQIRYVQLKKLMHKQNEEQMELYEEILDDGPDLVKIFEHNSQAYQPAFGLFLFLLWLCMQQYAAHVQISSLDLGHHPIFLHKQNEEQMELYEEILDDGPDLVKIFEHGQHIAAYRAKVERETDQMLADMPDYYVQPLLHCAHYHSIVNNSIPKYLKYQDLYTRKRRKFEKFFEVENLKPENYYQDGNAFALISGQKDDFGKIIFCTNSISKILGGDVNMYIGANISTLAPLTSQSFYSLFFENKNVSEQNELRGSVFRGFRLHKEGHLIELDFHLDVFPFLTQGFFFSLIIRPTQTKKEYILLRENGDIEGATRKVGSQLRLEMRHTSTNPVQTVNIKQVSEELNQINQAFNIVQHSEQPNKSVKEILEPAKGIKRKNSPIKYLCGTIVKKREERMSPREDNIDLELANKMYDMYNNDGKNIHLLPLNVKELRRNNTGNTEDSKPLTYHCKIETISQGSELVKLVILDENKRANASSRFLASRVLSKVVENDTPNKVPGEMIERKLIKEASIAMNPNYAMTPKGRGNLSDTRSENFGDKVSEGENPANANDYGIAGSRRHYQPKMFFTGQEDINKALRTNDYAATEGNLLSPMSPGGNPAMALLHSGNLLSPTGKALTITMDNEKQNANVNEVHYGSNSTESYREDDEKQDRLERLYDDVTSKASQKSRLSQSKQVTRAFNLALNTKYYSRILKFLFILCYLILAGVLGLQVQVKTSLDTAINNLQAKKELLRSSQQRDFLLVGVDRATRFVWDVGTKQLNTSLLGAAAGFTVATYRNSGNTSLISLAAVNQQVLINAGDLDGSSRDEIFLKDVGIYYNASAGVDDSPDYTVTNFQAADSIVETGFKAYACSVINITNCKVYFDFIFRNALNDLLVKSESVSNLLLESIQSQIQDTRDTLVYFLIVRLFLLSVICISLTWILIKQYLKEKINMLALMRLDANGVKEALDRLRIFKTSLETGDNIEGKSHKKIMQSAKKSYKSQFAKKKQKNMQNPDHKGILRRYVLFIAKSLICLLILSGFAIWTSISASNYIQFLKTEQSKLYYADNMATRTNFAFLAAMEVYASNNTSTMRNKPVLEQLQFSVSDMSSLTNTAIDVLIGDDADPNALIQSMLLDDGCQYLNSSSTAYCNIIKTKGKATNLVNLLSDYQAQISEKYQNFFTSDRTSTSLRTIEAKNYDLLLSMQRVLGDQSTLIATTINTIFQDKFDNVKVQGNVSFSVFVVVLVAISGLLWVLVFKEIREGINKFKNVLQAFPPSLILANFILKSFLVFTSRGVLDSVKNDI